MGIDWKSRWRYLHDTQFRKSTGVGVVAVVALVTIMGLYDLVVGQLADEPDGWLRARDVIKLLSWQVWTMVVAIAVAGFLFEGGYRHSRRLESEIWSLKDLGERGTKPHVLVEVGEPASRIEPLGIPGIMMHGASHIRTVTIPYTLYGSVPTKIHLMKLKIDSEKFDEEHPFADWLSHGVGSGGEAEFRVPLDISGTFTAVLLASGDLGEWPSEAFQLSLATW